MAGRKSDFTLPKFDDIFSTQEMRDDEKLAKIRDIPLELIDDFPDHPYRVQDDEDMDRLVESIKERGVITPAKLLKQTDFSISEIAKRVGFSDYNYFSRVYKKTYGKSPKHYRK